MNDIWGDRYATEHLTAGIDRHVEGRDQAPDEGLDPMAQATSSLAEASERAAKELAEAVAEVRRLVAHKAKPGA